MHEVGQADLGKDVIVSARRVQQNAKERTLGRGQQAGLRSIFELAPGRCFITTRSEKIGNGLPQSGVCLQEPYSQQEGRESKDNK